MTGSAEPDLSAGGLDLTAGVAVLARRGVPVAWLFGSRADGSARPESDADVAVLPADDAGWLVGQQVASDLQVLWGVPVDVVDLRTASLELRARVVQTGRLIHSADEPLRVGFTVDTRSRWFDFAPFQRRLTAAYLQRVANRGFSRGRP